jgi:hypothetical protein
MIFKIEPEHRPKPTESISDLVGFLNSSLKIDYMIAGGFPRDWYLDTPFNDIDIYLDISTTYIRDSKTLVKILKASRRFEVIREVPNRFIEAIFCDKAPFSKGRPKYRVQFILWHDIYSVAISSFDLEHCKFFIPIINQEPRGNFLYNNELISGEVYSYTKSLDALIDKQLVFSESALRGLEVIVRHSSVGISILEIFVKRILRFINRGFTPTAQVKDSLLEAFENYLTVYKVSDYPGLRSILLEEAEDYEDIAVNGSIYKESQVVRNLIMNLILIFPTEERARFLISPCTFLRETVTEILRDSKG